MWITELTLSDTDNNRKAANLEKDMTLLSSCGRRHPALGILGSKDLAQRRRSIYWSKYYSLVISCKVQCIPRMIISIILLHYIQILFCFSRMLLDRNISISSIKRGKHTSLTTFNPATSYKHTPLRETIF